MGKSIYRILLVDSDDENRRRIREMPVFSNQKTPFRIDSEADSVGKALEILRQKAPEGKMDLVIVSDEPPDCDGLFLWEEVRRDGLCQDLILLSEEQRYDRMRQCFLAGIRDYLIFPPDEILLGEALAHFEQEKALLEKKGFSPEQYAQRYVNYLRQSPKTTNDFCALLFEHLRIASAGDDFYAAEMLAQTLRNIWHMLARHYHSAMIDHMKSCVSIYPFEEQASIRRLDILFRKELEEIQDWLNRFYPPALKGNLLLVCIYIWNNYEQRLTLAEVAQTFYLSGGYLSAHFSEELHITFKRYVNSVKVEMSKELLRCGDLKIQEIAWKVGYQDEEYYSRVFRQITGMPPLKYRQTER